MPRVTIEPKQISKSLDDFRNHLNSILSKKGAESFVSRHETLGIISEEFHELLEAVRSGTSEELKGELLDTAIACLWGVVSLDYGKTDW